MEDKDRLQIYWQAFSMENSLLQSYRTLFMMVEAALLASGFVLLEVYDGTWIWLPAAFGFLVAVSWGVTCHYKGKDVDRWRDRILRLEPLVGRDRFKYLKPKVPKSWFKYPKLWIASLRILFQGGVAARYIFNYIVPGLVFGLWIIIMVRAVLN